MESFTCRAEAALDMGPRKERGHIVRKYAPYLITGAIVAWITTLVLLIALDPRHGAGSP